MITVANVTKIYTAGRQAAVAAICDANFVVHDGEFVLISGPSSSGKTTLLNIMAGLTLPTHGRVLYDGVEVWRLPDHEQSRFRNQHVGFVFQFPSLMPSLTVLENVLLPTTFLGDGEDAGERTRRAMDILSEVGCGDDMGAYPRQLPPSQQQRVLIARALVNRPKVLFADEPTGDLDGPAEHEIMTLFQALQRKLRLTIVMITPNSRLAAYATRSFHMTCGHLVETLPRRVST